MSYQHKDLASGRWAELSFCEQMANVGSEIERALKWKEKDNKKNCEMSFFRALELIDLTIKFNKKDSVYRELTRLREGICGYFTGDNIYGLNGKFLRKYFNNFNYAVRKAT